MSTDESWHFTANHNRDKLSKHDPSAMPASFWSFKSRFKFLVYLKAKNPPRMTWINIYSGGNKY